MPNDPLAFLDARSRIFDYWKPSWEMNERRAFGQAQVDLMSFAGESEDRFKQRQDRATYVNFMQSHAAAVTGQLRLQGAPAPESKDFSFGSLGKVRPLSEHTEDSADYGELIYYALDGVGGEASEMPVVMDAIDERAQHTGHRILMVETPPRRLITPNAATVVEPELTRADFLAGVRPYLLELSPLQAPMGIRINERTEFVILRVPVDSGKVVDGAWVESGEADAAGNGLGFYLLVRNGCTLLGPAYQRGGYWLYSPTKKLIRTGLWGDALRGEIPLWYHYGLKSKGTTLQPAESQSQTEGLGRVGVSLMDCMSARDWDAFDAARSGKWFSPASAETMSVIKQQWDQKNIHTGVPLDVDEKTGVASPVTMLDDSGGAVAPAVFQAIIDSKFQEAREQSFQALTSLPQSSGWSKEAGFLEAKAPYLARRASYRQQSDQNLIRNFEMRMGNNPSGFSRWKRDYNLEPVVEDISNAFDLLRNNGMRSPTLEPELAMLGLKHYLGGLPQPDPVAGVVPTTPEDYEAVIRGELRSSAEAAQRASVQATALAAQFGG